MARILISGFDAFGGSSTNASILVLEALQKRSLGLDVKTVTLPTSYRRSFEVLSEAMQIWRPDFILAFGEAAGRSAVSFERVAININDATIADNDGEILCDSPISIGGPSALFSTIPTRKLLAACCDSGVPAQLSYSAGTFVCNCLFYKLLEATAGTDVGAGFVHLPIVPATAVDRYNCPSMSTFDATTAAVSSVECLLDA